MQDKLEPCSYSAWQLIKIYWQSKQRLAAYLFLIAVLFMTVCLVGTEVAITEWYNRFYDALQDYNLKATIRLLWVFVLIATVSIIIQVKRFYLQQILGLRWRRWLTEQFVARWLAKLGYYYLETFDKYTDNPDQRIQEDINALVSYSLELLIGLVNAVTTILAFIYILWRLSGIFTLSLGSFGVLHIQGYLVWVSIIYAMVGTYFTFKIGHPLVPLNFEQQRREANFRYAAVDLRTNVESVALYRGEHHQDNVLRSLLSLLLDNWYMIILRQKLLLWYTSGYNQISVLLPLVVALPNYFNKVFKLGGLIQTLAAFSRIQDAFSFLVNSYTRIAEWRAVTQRLVTFLNHLYQLEQDVTTNNQFDYQKISQNKIIVKNVTIYTPQNKKLLANINEEFIHGKNYWIKGISGIGKSTLMCAISGIWPYGSGKIDLPEKKNIMFCPTKSYMPIGTLKQALVFPDEILNVSDEEIIKLLNECDLKALASQLDATNNWSEILSSGELQRISFVRIFIHKPDWVFLDETTSFLDLDNEHRLYNFLKTKLPNCSIISIGHRPSLAEYHDCQIDMLRYSVK